MSSIVIEAARLMDILPEADKEFAYEFIKKLVLAWDPDFTKVTAEEAVIIEKAEKMQQARKEKDYATADAIRNELALLGYIVKNTKDGYEIEKK